MYYAGPYHWNTEQLVSLGKRFNHLSSAKAYVEACKKNTGEHFVIVKVESVWTTKTLADYHAEGAI